MKNSTSWPSSSRKYSAWVRPVRPTRARAPGGSFIWPYTRATLDFAVELDDLGFDHFVIEVVALAGALAHAGEHRHAAVCLRDVVDQLHDGHGLADAGATEQADLAALRIRGEQVDDLDAGDEHLRLGRLVDELRRRTVDRVAGLGLDRAALVDRLADYVDDAAQHLAADRNGDGVAGIGDFQTADQAVGGVHGDGAHRFLAQMLRNLEHQQLAMVLGMQRVQNRRQVAFELHVDDGAQHLRDLADQILGHRSLLQSIPGLTAPRRRR